MIDSKHVRNLLGTMSDIMDEDEDTNKDITLMLEMTYEEHLKHMINKYIDLLSTTPKDRLEMKMSDIIAQAIN